MTIQEFEHQQVIDALAVDNLLRSVAGLAPHDWRCEIKPNEIPAGRKVEAELIDEAERQRDRLRAAHGA